MLTYVIEETDLNKRVDSFLQEKLPKVSRSFIKKLADEDKIYFNEKQIKAGYKFKTLGQLQFHYNLDDFSQVAPVDLDIIFEDDDLIVINKPSGLIVHARSRNWHEASVASGLRDYCQWPSLSYPASLKDLRRGIVHRLDKATSGLLICAKNEETADLLKIQFKQQLVDKTYLAIVDKNSKLPLKGLIDKPIARQSKNGHKFRIDVNGRPSQTLFKIKAEHNSYYLLELQPKTGRTHQIRVHLTSLNCPIVGDGLYKGSKAPRLMLHSQRISFKHPKNQTQLSFRTQIPKAFNQFLN